jgi:hypothetical protein
MANNTKKNEAVEEAVATEETKATEAVEEAAVKKVRIKIPRERADQEDVFVSVNMETFLIKRGVYVEVPDYVAEVLEHQEEMLEKIMLFNEARESK